MKLRLPCFLYICLLTANLPGQTNSSTEKSKPGEAIVEMEPYVVKGERILPEPESWLYIKVPALVLERGEREIVVPGYEIISTRGRKNTLFFVDQLQLRQAASAILFPHLVQALPRSPIILVLDDLNALREPEDSSIARAWKGDSLYTARALLESGGRADARYSVGTQMSIATSEVTQFASRYSVGSERMEMADDDEPLSPTPSNAIGRLQPMSKYLARAAANGGPLTVYLYGTFTGMQRGAITTSRNRPYSEEWLAREAWVSTNGFALSKLAKGAPPWLYEGLARLYGMVLVSYQQIDFGNLPFSLREMPPLSEVLTAPTRADLNRPLGGLAMATIFVHYCLYGDNGAYAPKFFQFLERLENEPFSEQLFKECFGIKISSFEARLYTYTNTFTWYKYTRFKGKLPDMPKVLAREATQAEVARLKAEMYCARNWTPLALDELRIAYWRGEREPNMLALLAFLEEHIGSISRAQKITTTLLSLPQPPARAYVVAAKLRLRELGAWESNGKKLNESDTASVMALLIKAREQGLLNEDFCATLSKLIIKSAESPTAEISTFITEAAKHYPLNQTIIAADKRANASSQN